MALPTLPLETVRARLAMNLHPSKAHNVVEGVQHELNEYLLRYSYDFDGVVLAYSKEKIDGHKAIVHPYFPYFRVSVTAALTVFRPKVGDLLVGTVNQVGDDYIGLLVLGVLNASISLDRTKKRFKLQGDCWQSVQDPDHRILVGSNVLFVAEEIDKQTEFFSITGSLEARSTGAAGHTEPQPSTTAPTPEKQNKKARKAQEDMASHLCTAANGEGVEEPVKKKRKEGKSFKSKEGSAADEHKIGRKDKKEKKKDKKDKKKKKDK